VADAVRLEALEAEFKSNPLEAGRLSERIEHTFLTAAGRSAARDLLNQSR
jgi:hypothetical protein